MSTLFPPGDDNESTRMFQPRAAAPVRARPGLELGEISALAAANPILAAANPLFTSPSQGTFSSTSRVGIC